MTTYFSHLPFRPFTFYRALYEKDTIVSVMFDDEERVPLYKK